MFACERGNAEAISLLLDKGADVTPKDRVSDSDEPYEAVLFQQTLSFYLIFCVSSRMAIQL